MPTDINSFFTRNGIPATDIGGGFPSVRIWEVNGSSYNLVIGAPTGSGLNVDGVMSHVIDGAQDDGFYSFSFIEANGFDPSKNYLIRIDGGTTIAPNERYQVGEISTTDEVTITPTDITLIAQASADAILEEPTSGHNTVGTYGHTINEIRSNTDSLVLSIQDVQLLISTLLKYDVNRTRIDPINKQLIVYDDDCNTVLRVFQLYDSLGNPSIEQVTERVPIAATDGLPTC